MRKIKKIKFQQEKYQIYKKEKIDDSVMWKLIKVISLNKTKKTGRNLNV